MWSTVSTTASRGLRTSAAQCVIDHVTVIGAGIMGSGIAQVSAQTGHRVTLVDTSEDLLSNSLNGIKQNVIRVAKTKFKEGENAAVEFTKDVLKRINTTTDPKKGSKDADIVIEAIIENLEQKKDLFGLLEQSAPRHALFASNTSSFSIKDIAVASDRVDKFGGLHFFNPVPVMKLLEVIRTTEMTNETFTTLMEFGKTIGKVTVEAKDTPGFIVNRLLLPYLIEAMWMSDRGDATLQDIDTAMELGAGFPMGPFKLMDFSGLDTLKFALNGIAGKVEYPGLSNSSASLDKLVSEGKFGVKAGEGYYKYK